MNRITYHMIVGASLAELREGGTYITIDRQSSVKVEESTPG